MYIIKYSNLQVDECIISFYAIMENSLFFLLYVIIIKEQSIEKCATSDILDIYNTFKLLNCVEK